MYEIFKIPKIKIVAFICSLINYIQKEHLYINTDQTHKIN